MTIKNKPNGKFDVRVTIVIGGKLIERRKRGFSSKGEARRAEEELKSELYLLKQKGWQSTVTWSNALEEYYSQLEKKVAFSTMSSAKSILELHTSIWKDRNIDSFSPLEIEKRIETVFVEKTMASKNKLLQYIRGVFKRQVDFGRISKSPCMGLTYGKISEKALIAMTRDEIKLLLQEAFKQDHPWYPIWRVVYELGLRSGEGLALRWSHIDFTNSNVTIGEAYCSKAKLIGPTKNRKIRTLPLNSSLIIFLKELKLKSDGEFVLPQLQDWKRGEAAEILRSFQNEIGIRGTNFHSLRASFITHLLLKGIPAIAVQKMVGHADLKTTQRYVRLSASDLNGATDALSLDLDEKIAAVIPLKKET